MGAVRMRVPTADKNITIIHTTPVHKKAISSESGIKYAQIKHCSQAKKCYGSWSCILARSDSLNLKRLDESVSYKQSFSLHKMLIDGLEWCGLLVDYCDVLSVWTLILTAPIHCRASICAQVMKCYISPNLFQ